MDLKFFILHMIVAVVCLHQVLAANPQANARKSEAQAQEQSNENTFARAFVQILNAPLPSKEAQNSVAESIRNQLNKAFQDFLAKVAIALQAVQQSSQQSSQQETSNRARRGESLADKLVKQVRFLQAQNTNKVRIGAENPDSGFYGNGEAARQN